MRKQRIQTSELEGVPAVMAWDVVSFGCSGAAETEKRTTQVTITMIPLMKTI